MDKSFNYIISPEISEFRKFSPKLKIGVLASGKGTNFQELINLSEKGELDIDIKVLITNKDDAGCIKRAKNSEIPYKVIRAKDFSQKELFELEIINTLNSCEVELVVMAGWMKIVSPFFINKFKNKIINIHPSLLPAYKGGSAINDSILNGSKITGCSVHFVDEEVDSGSLIMQAALSIRDDDDIESLSKRIHILEHKILPHSISNAGFLIRSNFMENY
ncbi:phosphoribosylglycinamide formyltransferase [Prochlorococcus marinus str. MU1404]|uniref:phosphoribosylglycinamide formyltransferase n=1 Tax=Prochlorococcus marinus TaxID=1219 RepID=UPI001ADC8BBF|nr:phosphoribosylglycinamide formyltransferase [Prochlorococcus marinus]MBO8230056.1 phosphoribosylglycinamide formyltransferase [Prochlorococcus marinus XMU1404]MBW3073170.1 phosphoribosylglycinamide formyltransferase [Prochlorococcus marinus str. MU1404]MCR8545607.1 phosphoribosylglycinamide formyltransferase [Prochlorococcus marinus CUG1432]